MGWIWMQAATLLLNHSQIRNAYSQFILAHIRLCTGIFSILQKQTFRIDIDIVRYTYIENIDAAAKSPQSCQTLCDPIDGTPPGSPRPWDSPGKNTGVGCHFLLQCVKVKSLSRVWLLATPWTAAHQAPPSMGFSRHEYWSGVPLPSPRI